MRFLQMGLLIIGAIVSVFLIFVSGYLNYTFGASLSVVPKYQMILGWVLAGFDALKAVLPVIVVVAITAGLKGVRWKVWPVYAFLAVLSALSTYQFISANRSETTAVRADSKEQRADMNEEIVLLKKQRQRLRATTRPVAAVQADYKARCYTKARRRWRSCKDLLKEMGQAKSLQQISRTLTVYREKKISIGVVGAVDAGVQSIVLLTGMGRQQVFTGLGVMTAIVLELATGLVPSTVILAIFTLWGLMQLKQTQDLPPLPAIGDDAGEKTHQPVEKGGNEQAGPAEFAVQADPPQGEKPAGIKQNSVSAILTAAKEIPLDDEPGGQAIGEVADYGRARLEIAGGSQLDAIAVHRDYQKWCRTQGLDALDYLKFHEAMAGNLIAEIGEMAVFEQPSAGGGQRIIYRSVNFKAEAAPLRVVEA